MKFASSGPPHLSTPRTVSEIMRRVIYALIPGIAAHVWYFGWGIVIQITLACILGLLFEYTVLKIRKLDVKLFIYDGSVLVTACLLCLSLPPLLPWWVNGIGMFFAVIVCKHLYGGLGFNIFNPAMVGYVVILISFPQYATQWIAPMGLGNPELSFLQTCNVIFFQNLPAVTNWDSVSQATPLDTLKTGIELNQMISEIRELPLFGDFGGRGWEWIANWFALGGIYLFSRRIISWHIPFSMIGVVLIGSSILYLIYPDTSPTPLQQLFSGSLIIGAFFIATDPVTSCSTPRGRLIFGAMIGVLIILIRQWGSYPDGVGFAILLMNCAVPLIDHYTQPRVFGHLK